MSYSTPTTCPNCDEEIIVLLTESVGEQESTARDEDATLAAALVEWEEVGTKHPYGASGGGPEDIDQRIKAEIQIDENIIPFEFFYKDDASYWTHVVRANTDAGRKSKDVFVSEQGLYFKSRGVPWDENKEWTFLSRDQLERRSRIAGLGDVVEEDDIVEDSEGRLALLLDVEPGSYVEKETLNEELVLKLAKGLLVMQSRQNPAP
jgi:hypothetical protein